MACNECDHENDDTFENNDSTALDALLAGLGLTRQEFDLGERTRFELSPRSWLHERLAQLGYVPAAAVERLFSTHGKDAA
jgi:hypothetical protein